MRSWLEVSGSSPSRSLPNLSLTRCLTFHPLYTCTEDAFLLHPIPQVEMAVGCAGFVFKQPQKKARSPNMQLALVLLLWSLEKGAQVFPG